MLRILLTATLLIANLVLQSQNIVVHIENIRNSNGVLRIALFQNEQQFSESKPAISLCVKKTDVMNGRTVAIFRNIAPGIYGIALLDDENSNGSLDKRFFVPKEGFGFSNFDDFTFTKPDFDDLSFKTDGNHDTQVTVKIKYF